jgi:hypothetical protein
MNIDINENFQSGVEDGSVSIIHGSHALAPHRVIFTPNQWDTIGSLQNGFKQLHLQKRLFLVVKYILKDYMIKSNGGNIPTEINQKKLVGIKVNKKPLEKKIITKSLKFLISNDLIQKKFNYAPGRNSIFYVAGNLMNEMLDPIQIKKAKKIDWEKELTRKYYAHGYNPNEGKTCVVCHTVKISLDFAIWEDKDCLDPVCTECGKFSIAAKSERRRFFLERESKLKEIYKLDLKPKRTFDLNDDDYINDLINEVIKDDPRFKNEILN